MQVVTGDGLQGHALEGCQYPGLVRDYIRDELSARVRGMDPVLTEQIRNRLLAEAGKRPRGVWSEAVSLIDVALWDVRGKDCGQAVWRMLGGVQNPIPAYVTFGIPDYDRDQLTDLARMLVGAGQERLKMVVGRLFTGLVESARGLGTDRHLREDAARVQAVREAIGDDVQLMIDANGSFNLSHALRLAQMVQDCDITWFEDPIHGTNVRLTRDLRTKTSIPVAAGSTGTEHLDRARALLVGDGVDILQPNVRDIGGFTQGIKAAALAEAFDVRIAHGGNWPHLNMHLQAGVPNGTCVEVSLGRLEASAGGLRGRTGSRSMAG